MKSLHSHANELTGSITPSVSIIIPTYNVERFIRDTIESILAQTYRDFEIIVVDDGSNDRTCEIVSAYGPPVRLIPQANAGVCAARNRGIEEAAGQFICLMDHDDYWFPDKLARQVEVMHAHADCGVVFSSFIRWHPNATGEFSPPESFEVTAIPDEIDSDFSGWIYHQFLIDCWMLTSTAMFRRNVFEKCGRFDEGLPYSEDWDLWLRVSREFAFVKLKRPNTLYRQHASQGSRVQRSIDYRTKLLTEATSRWGFCSTDGRCVDREVFSKALAKYHAEFAYEHLRFGNRIIALKSFGKAWAINPLELKFPLYMIAAAVGWKPRR